MSNKRIGKKDVQIDDISTKVDFGMIYGSPEELLQDVGMYILANTSAVDFVAVLGTVDDEDCQIGAAISKITIGTHVNETAHRHHDLLQLAAKEIRERVGAQ